MTILQKNFKEIRKEKEKARVAGDLDKRRMEHTSHKCFRCGSEDHLIEEYPKPSKEKLETTKASTFY